MGLSEVTTLDTALNPITDGNLVIWARGMSLARRASHAY